MEDALLRIIGVLLIMQGVFYAWQIYHTPTKHGWTFLSVATGTLMVITGEILAYLALERMGGFTLEAAAIASIGVLIILGGPMALVQLFKTIRENNKNNAIDEERFDQ